ASEYSVVVILWLLVSVQVIGCEFIRHWVTSASTWGHRSRRVYWRYPVQPAPARQISPKNRNIPPRTLKTVAMGFIIRASSLRARGPKHRNAGRKPAPAPGFGRTLGKPATASSGSDP